MIYRREQRPHVVAETNITDCAAVNKILGQRVSKMTVNYFCFVGKPAACDIRLTMRFLCPQWKMMTKKEQAKYYEEAKRERAIHAQLYPGWSAKDNYVRAKVKSYFLNDSRFNS